MRSDCGDGSKNFNSLNSKYDLSTSCCAIFGTATKMLKRISNYIIMTIRDELTRKVQRRVQ